MERKSSTGVHEYAKNKVNFGEEAKLCSCSSWSSSFIQRFYCSSSLYWPLEGFVLEIYNATGIVFRT